jgi:Ca2+-binding EF-hand superfamily protein
VRPSPTLVEDTFGLPSDKQIQNDLAAQAQVIPFEKIVPAMQAFDFDNNGLISVEDCKYALKQLKIIVTPQIEEEMKNRMRYNWKDEYCVDYMPFCNKIAREPPG